MATVPNLVSSFPNPALPMASSFPPPIGTSAQLPPMPPRSPLDLVPIIALANKSDWVGVIAELAKGVDVNTADSHGSTVLTLAACGRQFPMCLTLVLAGADVLIRNKSGMNMAQMGVNTTGSADMLYLSRAAGDDLSGVKVEPHLASMGGKINHLEVARGYSPARAAAKLGHEQLMLKVLARYDSPEHPDVVGTRQYLETYKPKSPAAMVLRSWLAQFVAHGVLDEIEAGMLGPTSSVVRPR